MFMVPSSLSSSCSPRYLYFIWYGHRFRLWFVPTKIHHHLLGLEGVQPRVLFLLAFSLYVGANGIKGTGWHHLHPTLPGMQSAVGLECGALVV